MSQHYFLRFSRMKFRRTVCKIPPFLKYSISISVSIRQVTEISRSPVLRIKSCPGFKLSFKPNSVYKILIRETDGIITKPVSYTYTSKNGEWPFDKKKISFGRGSYIEVSQDPPFPVDDTKVPIYRFFHKTINEHFYTKSSNPKGSWIAEGVEFYAYNEQVEGTVPIYRFLHNSYKDHFYTRNSNPDGNWKKQGVEFYAYPTSVEGTVPVYRYYSKVNKDHFYTTEFSPESSLEGDWIKQGIEFYAFPSFKK